MKSKNRKPRLRRIILSTFLVLALLLGSIGIAGAAEITYSAPDGLQGWIMPDSSITPSTAETGLGHLNASTSTEVKAMGSGTIAIPVTATPVASATPVTATPVASATPVTATPVTTTPVQATPAVQTNPAPVNNSSIGGSSAVSYILSDGAIRVTLVSSQAITAVRDFTLIDPKRNVFDLAGLNTAEQPAELVVANGLISKIRFGTSPEDGSYRMVFDLGSTNSSYTYSLSADKTSMTITLAPVTYTSASTNTQVGVQKSMENVTVVLDPGHGGSDPGAVGPNNVYESNVNLAAAFKAKAYLEAMGAKVVMTRESDVYLTLDERPAVANNLGADIFVSIHSNASVNRSPGGTSTHYIRVDKVYNGDQNLYNSSISLAKNIQDSLVSLLGLTDRGIQTNNYAVLRGSHIPAVLVEMAFISNYNEEALLNSDSFRDKAGLGIAQGIAAYFGN